MAYSRACGASMFPMKYEIFHLMLDVEFRYIKNLYFFEFIYLGSNPTKWTHLGSCLQQWSSYYQTIFKIFIIDGLYSVILYIDIVH